MLTTAIVHNDVRCAAAVYTDTCSFALTALSPNFNLWDAIPRDIDTLRHEPEEEVRRYCERLSTDAEEFLHQVRRLLEERRLVVLDQIKHEVQGQKGRAHGLRLRASQRFPYAPKDLVAQTLSFQMAVHDAGLAAPKPQLERRIVDDIMRRLGVYWRELSARTGERAASVTDRLLFAAAAANAILIENGSKDYGAVVLVSRDFNHVFRMYSDREELLRPVCRKSKLLCPRNFLFHPTLQAIELPPSVIPVRPRVTSKRKKRGV